MAARTLAYFTPAAAEFETASFPQPGVSSDASGGRPYLAFAIGEVATWTFRAPQGLSAPLSMVADYAMASATANAVELRATLEAISDGDATDTDAAESFDSANDSGDFTVPGTAGHLDQLSVTLTNNDSIAAGDMCRLRVERITPAGSSAAGDMHIYGIELRDNGL